MSDIYLIDVRKCGIDGVILGPFLDGYIQMSKKAWSSWWSALLRNFCVQTTESKLART